MSHVLDDPLWAAPGSESAGLDALADTLSRGSGFALSIARVTSDRHRRRLEQELISRVSALRPERRMLRLELKPPIEDVLEIASTAAATEHPDALLISGLELAFEDLYSDHGARLLERLDSERARLASALPCALLLWVSSPLLTGLAVFAPSLVRETARLYAFDEPDERLVQLLDEIQQATPAQLPALNDSLQAHAGRCILAPDLSRETMLAAVLQEMRDSQGRPKGSIRLHFDWPRCGLDGLFALGAAAMRAGRFEHAVLLHDKASRIAAETERYVEQIRAQFLLGDAYRSLDQLAPALDSYRFALMQAKRFGELELLVQAAAELQKLCVQRLARMGPRDSVAQAPPRAPALGATEVRRPTAASLHALLDAVLLTDCDFDLFCTEQLLEFAAQYPMSLSRSVRTELILQQIEPERILEALEGIDREAVRRNAGLLVPSDD